MEDVVASKMRHPGMAKCGDPENRKRTRSHMEMQDAISQSEAMHSLDVFADTLCRGGEDGETEARRVFNFCGLDLNPSTYHECATPERWHGA